MSVGGQVASSQGGGVGVEGGGFRWGWGWAVTIILFVLVLWIVFTYLDHGYLLHAGLPSSPCLGPAHEHLGLEDGVGLVLGQAYSWTLKRIFSWKLWIFKSSKICSQSSFLWIGLLEKTPFQVKVEEENLPLYEHLLFPGYLTEQLQLSDLLWDLQLWSSKYFFIAIQSRFLLFLANSLEIFL